MQKSIISKMIIFLFIVTIIFSLIVIYGVLTKGIIEINMERISIFAFLISSIFLILIKSVKKETILIVLLVILIFIAIFILVFFNDFFAPQATLGNLGAG